MLIKALSQQGAAMREHLAWEGCQTLAMTQDPNPQQGSALVTTVTLPV